MDLNPEKRIFHEFSKRKTIRYILNGTAIIFLLLSFASTRYGTSLTGLSVDSEMAIFLSIALVIAVISVLYWRCPNYNKLFWWRFEPKSCRHCGVELIDLKSKEARIDPDDYRYYIKLREANSRKFFLFLIPILAFNIGLFVLLTNIAPDIPYLVLVLIFLVFFGIPMYIIDKLYRRCPKCGRQFGRWVPDECPTCNTRLKDYNWSDYPPRKYY